jgi:hypothetical protein
MKFRLRTLFVVVTLLAVPCAFMGHEAAFVRARQAFIKAHWSDSQPVSPVFADWGPSRFRELISDRFHPVIVLSAKTPKAERECAANLFPEADIGLETRISLNFSRSPPENAAAATIRRACEPKRRLALATNIPVATMQKRTAIGKATPVNPDAERVRDNREFWLKIGSTKYRDGQQATSRDSR